MQHNGIFYLNATKEDKQHMREVLEYVLSPAAIQKTRLMHNTQNNEAYNRSLSTNLPKHLKHSKSLPARRASTILRINEGPAVAFALKSKKFKAELSGGQKKHFGREHKKYKKSKAYVKSKATIRKRHQRDSKTQQARREYQTQNPTNPDPYKKHQLDEEDQEKGLRRGLSSKKEEDHNYLVFFFFLFIILYSMWIDHDYVINLSNSI